jgi:hypothetical protein
MLLGSMLVKLERDMRLPLSAAQHDVIELFLH